MYNENVLNKHDKKSILKKLSIYVYFIDAICIFSLYTCNYEQRSVCLNKIVSKSPLLFFSIGLWCCCHILRGI